jgi:hypothetical protein
MRAKAEPLLALKVKAGCGEILCNRRVRFGGFAYREPQQVHEHALNRFSEIVVPTTRGIVRRGIRIAFEQ